jgi:hypothetical protein
MARLLEGRARFLEIVVRVDHGDELHVLDGIREFSDVHVVLVHGVAVDGHAVAREEQVARLRATRVVVMEGVEGVARGGLLVGHDARGIHARSLRGDPWDDRGAGSARRPSARGANARRRGGRRSHARDAHLFRRSRYPKPKVPLAHFPCDGKTLDSPDAPARFRRRFARSRESHDPRFGATISLRAPSLWACWCREILATNFVTGHC